VKGIHMSRLRCFALALSQGLGRSRAGTTHHQTPQMTSSSSHLKYSSWQQLLHVMHLCTKCKLANNMKPQTRSLLLLLPLTTASSNLRRPRLTDLTMATAPQIWASVLRHSMFVNRRICEESRPVETQRFSVLS
jgi:hypothetical protein